MSVRPFVRPFVRSSVGSSVRLSVHLSRRICFFFYLFFFGICFLGFFSPSLKLTKMKKQKKMGFAFLTRKEWSQNGLGIGTCVERETGAGENSAPPPWPSATNCSEELEQAQISLQFLLEAPLPWRLLYLVLGCDRKMG